VTSADPRAAESLDRFLDELAGSEIQLLTVHPAEFDPSLAWAARRLRAHDDALSVDPAFADRLLQDILANAERPKARPLPEPHDVVNPASGRSPKSIWPVSAIGGKWSRSRWIMAQLATAVLLAVTLISSFLAFGPGHRERPEDAPAIIPAAATIPDAGQEVATPVWESRGDPAQPLDNPGHLTVAPDGNLWVMDGLRNQFQILSPDGNFLEHWGTAGTDPGQFILTDGIYPFGAVAFDRAGNLYVADTGNFRIQKFAPDRSFILAWGRKGKGDGEFLWPDTLAIDQQGNVYVLDGGRDDIQVFDANGAYLRTIGAYGTANGHFMFPDNGGLVIDTTGNLWVADNSNQRIQELSPEGEFLKTISSYGLSPGKLVSPNGVAVDEAGHVFVVDTASAGVRLQLFSSAGAFLGAWSKTGGHLSEMDSLALDDKGDVYVTDYDGDRILKLRLLPPFAPVEIADMQSITTPEMAAAALLWQASGSAAQPLDHPSALTFDPQGRLWVTDSYHNQFQILSADGEYLETWGAFGSGPGEFNFQKSASGVAWAMNPQSFGGIAFAPDGSFYVADSGNHRVQKFSPDRAFLFSWGSEGKGDGQFEWPSAVALDSQGRVYVADNLRSDVQVFSPGGAYLRTIGHFGTGEGQLYLFGGGYVTVDQKDAVWVTDASNDRLQRFSPEGDLLATVGRAGAMPGQFSWPGQVAMDGAGRLFVADSTNRRVQVFTPDGSIVTTFGDEALGPDYSPAGVALDGAGNVYVSDYYEDRVLKFSPISP
jgi:DNA-binding beta-propeller fold protein YncE